MTTLLFLQISVSLIFFANKILVLMKKRTGWLLGVIAAVLAVFYFIILDRYVYTTLEFGLIALMGYGFLMKDKKSPRVEKIMNIMISLVMLALTYFAFSGFLTICEFMSSLGLLFGTYFLTHGKARTGWIFYFAGHSFACYIGYKGEIPQTFFANLQLASAIVSVIGAVYVNDKS